MRSMVMMLTMLMSFEAGMISAQEPEKSEQKKESRWGFASAVVITGNVSTVQSGQGLKKIAIAGAVYNAGSGEIGVSRMLSSRTMLLLSATLSWSDSESEIENSTNNNVSKSESQGTGCSLTVGPEFRRYYPRSQKLGLYAGLQPTASYTKSSSENRSLTSFRETEVNATSIGLRMSLGVEYFLLDNLSLSVHFRPLSYGYTIENRKDRTEDSSSAVAESDSETHQNNLSFSQSTGLFVRIYF